MLTSGPTRHIPVDIVALQVQYRVFRSSTWHGCPAGIPGSEWVAFRPRVPCLFKGASWNLSPLSYEYAFFEKICIFFLFVFVQD